MGKRNQKLKIKSNLQYKIEFICLNKKLFFFVIDFYISTKIKKNL